MAPLSSSSISINTEDLAVQAQQLMIEFIKGSQKLANDLSTIDCYQNYCATPSSILTSILNDTKQIIEAKASLNPIGADKITQHNNLLGKYDKINRDNPLSNLLKNPAIKTANGYKICGFILEYLEYELQILNKTDRSTSLPPFSHVQSFEKERNKITDYKKIDGKDLITWLKNRDQSSRSKY